MNELNCPARTYGSVAVCHFCIYIPGGPSALCARMLEQYHKTRATLVPNHALSVSPDLPDVPQISD